MTELLDRDDPAKAESPAPSSEFVLRRILKNDMQGVPGARLNAEMRGEFARMLREREEAKARGRGKGHAR